MLASTWRTDALTLAVVAALAVEYLRLTFPQEIKSAYFQPPSGSLARML